MIYIAGTPRSGSTWTFEIALELKRRGYHDSLVTKQHILDKKYFDDVMSGARCITSTRYDIDAVMDSYYSRPATAADDAPLSRWELFECTCDSIKQSFLLPGLKLTHSDITDHPASCIVQIANYLECDLSSVEVVEIAEKFSKANVQKGGVGFAFRQPGHLAVA